MVRLGIQLVMGRLAGMPGRVAGVRKSWNLTWIFTTDGLGGDRSPVLGPGRHSARLPSLLLILAVDSLLSEFASSQAERHGTLIRQARRERMHRTTAQDARSHCSPVSRTMHLVIGIIALFRTLHA